MDHKEEPFAFVGEIGGIDVGDCLLLVKVAKGDVRLVLPSAGPLNDLHMVLIAAAVACTLKGEKFRERLLALYDEFDAEIVNGSEEQKQCEP